MRWLKPRGKECRSTHFVLVDAYQDLPDDFMMQALTTPREARAACWATGSIAEIARGRPSPLDQVFTGQAAP